MPNGVDEGVRTRVSGGWGGGARWFLSFCSLICWVFQNMTESQDPMRLYMLPRTSICFLSHCLFFMFLYDVCVPTVCMYWLCWQILGFCSSCRRLRGTWRRILTCVPCASAQTGVRSWRGWRRTVLGCFCLRRTEGGRGP